MSDTNAHNLPVRPVSPSDNHLVRDINVRSDNFHSQQLAQRVTSRTSLVLYFRGRRHGRVIALTPTTMQCAFLLSSFTGVYSCYTHGGVVTKLAVRRHLRSMVGGSSVVHPVVPRPGSVTSPRNHRFNDIQGITRFKS